MTFRLMDKIKGTLC